jgi:hypothetical protein
MRSLRVVAATGTAQVPMMISDSTRGFGWFDVRVDSAHLERDGLTLPQAEVGNRHRERAAPRLRIHLSELGEQVAVIAEAGTACVHRLQRLLHCRVQVALSIKSIASLSVDSMLTPRLVCLTASSEDSAPGLGTPRSAAP